MFGDVNVKVEDGNLGRSSSTGTGTSIKIGISNVESKSPILISGTMNAKKSRRRLATHLLLMPALMRLSGEHPQSIASR